MPQAIRRGLLVGALVAAGAAPGAVAQTVTGLGDDALTLPRGAVRVRVQSTLTTFDQRYGRNTPGRPDGAREPLGIDFNIDALGSAQFPTLGPVQTLLRRMTGIPDFTVSLGRTQLSADAIINTVPLSFEAGLSKRFTIGVMVPIVQARTVVGVRTGAGRREGNLGLNPARTGDSLTLAANSRVVTEFTAAQTQLATLIATCTASPSASPSCPQVLASGPALQASADAFRQGVAAVYGTTATGGAAFVPVDSSEGHLAILARIAGFRALFAQLGITSIGSSSAPRPAAARVGTTALNGLLADSAFGFRAQPLGSVMTTGLGDIEVGVKFRAFDSFGFTHDTVRFHPGGMRLRQSFGALFRAGTGRFRNPDNFLDLGTGNGQHDVEVRSFTDLLLGRHLFTSVTLRYVRQLQDTEVLRITDQPEQVLAPAWRRREVTRDLGDQVEVEVTPRWVVSEYLALAGQYQFRRKGRDRFTGSVTVPPAETGLTTPVTLDAGTLALETEATEHRMGAGLMFSTVAAYTRGKAPWPVELHISQTRTTLGAGGNVPKLTITSAQLRVYGRLARRR